MRHLDDIGPGFRQQGSDRRQLAGPVDDVDGEFGQATLSREFTGQDGGNQPRIDVAAGQNEADVASRKQRWIGENRC